MSNKSNRNQMKNAYPQDFENRVKYEVADELSGIMTYNTMSRNSRPVNNETKNKENSIDSELMNYEFAEEFGQNNKQNNKQNPVNKNMVNTNTEFAEEFGQNNKPNNKQNRVNKNTVNTNTEFAEEFGQNNKQNNQNNRFNNQLNTINKYKK